MGNNNSQSVFAVNGDEYVIRPPKTPDAFGHEINHAFWDWDAEIIRKEFERVLDTTTKDACEEIVKPKTLSKKESYIDLINAGKKANKFVSHAWKYSFQDIVRSLEGNNEDGDIFWFDICTVNQHKSETRDFNWWQTTFLGAVKEIGCTVLVLSPWEEPIPLTRSWCIWEIFSTLTTQSRLEIVMSDMERFLGVLVNDFDRIMKELCKLDAEEAKAGGKNEQTQIKEAILAVGGFEEVNSKCQMGIQGALAEIARNAVAEESYGLMIALGSLLDGQAKYEDALEWFEKALEGYLKEEGGVEMVDLPGYATSQFESSDHESMMIAHTFLKDYQEQDKNGVDLNRKKKIVDTETGGIEGAGNGLPLARESLPLEIQQIPVLQEYLAQHPAATLEQVLLHLRQREPVDMQQPPPPFPGNLQQHPLGEEGGDEVNETHKYPKWSEESLAQINSSEKENQLILSLLNKERKVLKYPASVGKEVSECYNKMALVYKGLGAYEKALKFHEKALAIYLKLHGPRCDCVASMYRKAIAYEHQGANKMASHFYNKWLDIKLKSPPTDLHSLANFCIQSADVCRKHHPSMADESGDYDASTYGDKQSAYETALGFLEKALAIKLKSHGPDHPVVASVYERMASNYDSLGAYKKALALYEKTLAIKSKLRGPDYPSVAATYDNMACVYKKQGAYERALALFEKTLAIESKSLGPDHPLVATTYSSIVAIYEEGAYPYEKALGFYEKAAAIQLKSHNPDVGLTYTAMGLICYKAEEYSKAIEYFE